MMRALFGDPDPAEPAADLTSFQHDAVLRLGPIMKQFGGALLCDSVGLGKTHVAARIIRDAIDSGAEAFVIAPSTLRSHWQRHLARLPRCRWISHAALSRGRMPRSTTGPRIVVVDEAHAFRNPRTQRYRSLALAADGAHVLLITATPVNNSLHDFASLVRLFAGDGEFACIGVPDLQTAVDAAAAGRPRELQLIAQTLMVRRTRDMVKLWPDTRPPRRAAGTGSAQPALSLRFPVATPTQLVHYETAFQIGEVAAGISSLHLPAHRAAAGGHGCELLRMGLLKRLESSVAAFTASLVRLHRLTDAFMHAAQQDLFFDVRRDRSLAADVDGAVQLVLQPLALGPWPATLSRSAAIHDADGDIAVLRALAAAVAGHEPKPGRLLRLLTDELAHEKVIVFTEFRDTALAIRQLLAHSAGVALIHGGDAWLGRSRASRRAIIERFAPFANHVRAPSMSQAVRLLIATDVLAEGLNLQDASTVISYDLPWNPVRLAQRAGRIDRLGSPHAAIRVLAFAPAHGLDQLLGLLRRIRRKLRHIRTVGGDAPVIRRTVAARRPIDAAAHAREYARIAWLRAAPARTAAHEVLRRPPRTGAASVRWSRQPAAATLCCVQYHGETILILLRDDGTDEVANEAAWEALRHAFEAGDTLAPASLNLRNLRRRVHRCLARTGNARRARPGPARDGAALVRQWLGSRPGGPSAAELAGADTVLALLSESPRAGAVIRIQDIIDGSPSAGDAVRRLRELARTRPPQQPRAGRPRLLAVIRLEPS